MSGETKDSAAFHIEPLGPAHNRAAFFCGVPALDAYLKKQARQDVRKRVAAVFVLTTDGATVAGYYTLSQHSVKLETVPEELAKRLPKYPDVPVTLIGRLAVSQDFKGRRLGEFMLMDALKRTLDVTPQIASAAVVVDAKSDAAAAFYRKYGFIDLPGIARRLFLPMATIAKMFAA